MENGADVGNILDTDSVEIPELQWPSNEPSKQNYLPEVAPFIVNGLCHLNQSLGQLNYVGWTTALGFVSG